MYTWIGVETWQDISHPFVLITMPVDVDFSPEVPIGYHYTTVFTLDSVGGTFLMWSLMGQVFLASSDCNRKLAALNSNHYSHCTMLW